MVSPSGSPEVLCKILDDGIDVPSRAHPTDAGIDLRTVEDVELMPGARALVGTGIAVAIPVGWVGLVCPRSGLAAHDGVTITNGPGVVDSDYRGEIKVILQATSHPVAFKRGDRVAQLVIVPCHIGAWRYVDDLESTERGEGGHGSTGR